jgi:Spy/CpxP family protein refolding chaperone
MSCVLIGSGEANLCCGQHGGIWMSAIRKENHGQSLKAVRSRSLIKFVAVMFVLMICGGSALAAGPFQGMRMRRAGHHQMPSVDDQLKRMTKQLKLSDDQQAKVKPILEEQRNQMQQLRSDSSLSQDEKMGKMRELRQQSSSQIKALLNDQQQKKFDEVQKKRQEKWQSRQSGKS